MTVKKIILTAREIIPCHEKKETMSQCILIFKGIQSVTVSSAVSTRLSLRCLLRIKKALVCFQ